MRRILWFRRDLRVEDNPLLSFGAEVLPIFIFDENILKELPKNDKRVTFIFHHVVKLKSDLQKVGLDLKIFYGNPEDIFEELRGFDEVVASGDYDSYAKERDIKISHILHFRYLSDTYIFKPKEVLKDNGEPYFVFTPFYKKARALLTHKNIDEVKVAEHNLAQEDYEGIHIKGKKLPLELGSIGFIKQNIEIVSPHIKLDNFLKKIDRYQETREYLSVDATSSLSVDLRFGTISVRAVLRALFSLKSSDIEPFIRQLIFRDFYAYLLFHIPTLERQNYKYDFNGVEDDDKFKAFCEARTGVPIVDAGVRELLQTGQMHNRVRMVAASFFTKDLLLPWQWGEKFFALHLLDYDLASNALSWQWSAGTGVDPQPYFRVFNPYLQSKKFDNDAFYIKKWLPELRDIEAKNIHNEAFLLSTYIKDYSTLNIVHKEAKARALSYYKKSLH
ncbi:deoxyribodipyrimidine photo-lyase [Sulfurimonas sp.]|uniref:cryptochrome/photolyase family protein n=1 Tax=Sulfurimonas sp. TaxID=2022749 RepID=UPI0025F6C0AE|nr:deoxyribodipyrimidine photo-lyase [Sulfurimonas sp.]MBW6488052.1 DNA photolyase family protein [Sulfurimonas sp.]